MLVGATRLTLRDMTTSSETFHIPVEAAEAYEATFVPALFAEWAPRLLEFAGVRPGNSVLDVACGTGVVARAAAQVVGADGRVVGVDLNEAMLTVARRVAPDIDFRRGDVAALPVPDNEFDVALCQMALMFFPDRVGAVREMGRVVTIGGTVAVVAPATLHEQPAYAPFVDMVAGFVGPSALSLMSTYFSCGEIGDVTSVFDAAGLEVSAASTQTGIARFASVNAAVAAEIESTPMIDRITDDEYKQIRDAANDVFGPHVTDTGELHLPLVCHLVAGVRPIPLLTRLGACSPARAASSRPTPEVFPGRESSRSCTGGAAGGGHRRSRAAGSGRHRDPSEHRRAARCRHRHRQRRRAGAGELLHLRAAPHDGLRRDESATAHARPRRSPGLLGAGSGAVRARMKVNLMAAPAAIGPITYPDTSELAAECDLVAGAGFAETFMTSASPGIVASAMENRYYATRDEYVRAVAAALGTEYRFIVDRGLLLQIDVPDLAMERHTLFADAPLREFLGWVELVVDAINHALAGIDPGRVRLHVCWGNYEGPHTHDVALAEILPLLYEANVGALVLSMANARHAHEHACFERHPLPEDMALVVGVIDTTSNYVEHEEVVADRIERVAQRSAIQVA